MEFTTYKPVSGTKSKKRILFIKWLPVLFFTGLIVAGISFGIILFSSSFFTVGEVQADLKSLWENHSWEEIVSYTEQDLEKNPLKENSLVFAGMGHFYASLELPQDQKVQHLNSAVKYFRRYLALDQTPFLGEVHFILGKAYYYLGRYYSDLSINHLEKSLEMGYSNKELYSFLGLAYSALEEYEKAIYFFERGLGYAEDDLLRWSLAFVHYKNNNLNEAEKNLQLALMNTNENALLKKYRLLLAEIYLKQSRIELAEQEYDKILQLDPNSAEGHFFLGEIYSKKGEPERARSYWRRALQLDPYHYNATMRLRGN